MRRKQFLREGVSDFSGRGKLLSGPGCKHIDSQEIGDYKGTS